MHLNTTAKKHLLFVDSIRALAAVFVVIHHATLQYFLPGNSLTGFRKLTLMPFFYGHFAVDVFIVLSGFSLMLSVTENDYQIKGGVLTFLKRRAIRILPPFYIALIISLLLIWLLIGQKTDTHWDVSLPASNSAALTLVFLINDFFRSTSSKINHSFWSICVECRIYLFFPFLVWVWKKYGSMLTLFVAMIISSIGLLLLILWHNYNANVLLDSSGVTPYIILFTFGMLAADLAYTKTQSGFYIRTQYLKSPVRIVLLGCIFYLATYELVRLVFKLPFLLEKNIHRNLLLDVNDIFTGIITAFMLFICTISDLRKKKQFWLVKILSWQPLVFLGTFSYSLYLIHAPLVQVFTQYICSPLHLNRYYSCWMLILLGTPLIILCAYLFFLLFERPFLTMGKKTTQAGVEIKAITSPAP